MADRKQEILDAALLIADERGLAGVSMRAVAERVGVTPMALYPHVGSKSALLDGMVGRLLGGLVPAMAAEQDWADQLSAYARQAREMTRLHPWAATLLFGRPAVTAEAVRFVDAIYTALLAAGVPPALVPRIERLVSTFMLGFGASQAGGRFGQGALDPRGRRGQLPEGDLPGHAALARWLDCPVDWTAEFEADLADLRRMIAAIAAEAAAGAEAETEAGTGTEPGQG
ncbi:TetR/AcrR family transcriptional regulator [Streptacidiphilus cavernicola]|uniref:TetR/AcrR family transcriptional regulator n=1 Tax=Streptacidiphilus cavernicola TaxID=3342716 RepID=A0ABV6W2N7_9ACTN